MQKKKIYELLIGSNNKGKVKEIKDLLPKRVKVHSPNSYKIKDPRESGKTFLQNSLIKARYYSKKTGKICIADDSGLEIDVLRKAPGIYSARWGGKKNDFNLAIKKVFKKLDRSDKNWKAKKIRARFICALTIYGPKIRTVQSTGKIEGKISNKKKGNNGFGYDPIFVPNGYNKTFGELDRKIKISIDHRYKAFSKIKFFFN